MKFEPHPYQTQAIRHLLTHPQAALFLDLGLGKTVIALTAARKLITTGQAHRALIVSTKRAATLTWPQELAKWDHLADVTSVVCAGTPKQRQQALNAQAQLTIINRENIPWLVDQYPMKQWPFDLLILDELTSFKNPRTSRFKALRRIRSQVERVWGLTGTPTPQSLLDLWPQMFLIDQGERLGARLTTFRETYFTPGKRNGNIVYTWDPKPGTVKVLSAKIDDIALSMKAEDYLTLPDRIDLTHETPLPDDAEELANELTRDLFAEIGDSNVIDIANAATLAGKLQQIASGTLYDSETGDPIEVHDAKIEALQDLVESLNGEPLLVAYWFRHDLNRIQAALPEARHLNKPVDFDEWNQRRVPVGLIHPASVGHGLNLQAGGHHLCWYTPIWSLELYLQTNGRLHRQGQELPVTVHHLVAPDTIDVDIMEALERKTSTQEAVLDAVKRHYQKIGE